MNAILDQVGPDEEIERCGKEFEAWRIIHPQAKKPMTFEQYVNLQEPRRSNAWAYTSNRRGRSLITF